MRPAKTLVLAPFTAALAAAALTGCGSASDTGNGPTQAPKPSATAPQSPGPGAGTAAPPTGSPLATGAATGQQGSRAQISKYGENGKTEVEVELHSAAAGQNWNLTFSHAGAVFSRAMVTTVASESGGTFSINRFIPQDAGGHVITVRLANQATGEVIMVSAAH